MIFYLPCLSFTYNYNRLNKELKYVFRDVFVTKISLIKTV